MYSRAVPRRRGRELGAARRDAQQDPSVKHARGLGCQTTHRADGAAARWGYRALPQRGTTTGHGNGTGPRGAATGPDHGTVRRESGAPTGEHRALPQRSTTTGYGNGTARRGMAMRAHNMGHGNGGEWQRDCTRGRMDHRFGDTSSHANRLLLGWGACRNQSHRKMKTSCS